MEFGIDQDVESFGAYIKSVRESGERLLNAEEEVELSKVIEAGVYAEHLVETGAYGDRDPGLLAEVIEEGNRAMQRFIGANLPLVISIARRYYNMPYGTMSRMDVIAEGNLGLAHAVEKFDYTKGFKFSTYATWWVRLYMSRALENNHRVLHLSAKIVKAVERMNEVEEQLRIDLDRSPLDVEIAKELDITEAKLKELRIYGKSVAYLNQIIDQDTELGDFIAAQDDTEESAMRGLMREEVEAAIETLDEIEQIIIRGHFGLNGKKTMSHVELAKELNVSASTVRAYEGKAFAKLRRRFPSLAEY